MTTLLGCVILLILIVALAPAAMGVRRAVRHLANVRSAWPHRKRLALIAYQIEHDDHAPEKLRHMIGRMADNAFNKNVFREIVSMPPTVDTKTAIERFRSEIGYYYFEILTRAVTEFAAVVLLSEHRAGLAFRAYCRDAQKTGHGGKYDEGHELHSLERKVEAEFLEKPPSYAVRASA